MYTDMAATTKPLGNKKHPKLMVMVKRALILKNLVLRAFRAIAAIAFHSACSDNSNVNGCWHRAR